MDKQVLKENPTKELCPLPRNPVDDCYSAKMSSQYIEGAIHCYDKIIEICESYKHVNGNGDDNL